MKKTFWNWLRGEYNGIYPISLKWDAELNELMDTNAKVSKVDDGHIYTLKIGPHEVWVESYPYAFGHPYGKSVDKKYFLPTKSTRKRLREYLKDFLAVPKDRWED